MSIHIILGDVHLGKGLSIGKVGVGTALNSRIIDQINLLDWTLEQAVRRDAERIILTGDVFEDPKPHPSLVKLFVAWLNRCSDEHIEVDVLYGNHDIIRSGQFVSSALDIVSEAGIPKISLHNDIFTRYADGVCFTYVPFRDRRSFGLESHDAAVDVLRKKLIFELAEIPNSYKKVLIGHLALEGSIYVGDEISDSSNELFCPLDMFEGYDFVWMGHVHKPQVLRREPHIAHVGSMDLTDFGEADHEKIIVVVDTDSPAFFEEVTIPSRPLAKIVIPVSSDVTDTTEYVRQLILTSKSSLKNAIVRVEVQLLAVELASIDRKAIETVLQESGVFHIAGLSETKKLGMIKKKDDAGPGTEITNLNDVGTAIKVYAKAYIDDKDVDGFLSLADSIIQEVKAEAK